MMEIGALGVAQSSAKPSGALFVYFGRKQRRIFIDTGGELMIPYMRLVCNNQKSILIRKRLTGKVSFFRIDG